MDATEQLFWRTIEAVPEDATPRLAFADWLDETGRDDASARVRWWAGARNELRAAVAWDEPPADWSDVEKAIERIRGEWCRRLYAVEVARIVREKYPLAPEWAAVAKVADGTLAVAERYALLLATEEELSAARSAAWSARSAAWSAESAGSAWSAAESAAGSAESAAWSAESARSARSAAWSAAWSAGSAGSAAWSAGSARSARSAAWSAALAMARLSLGAPAISGAAA